MKGTDVESMWRTAQFFISNQAAGVFEVEVNQTDSSVRCNCPVWKSRQACKHTKYVMGKVRSNKGHYAVYVPENVPEHEIANAVEDPTKFRAFIIKYGKVEVL